MLKVKLGRTGLVVAKNGFGALPIQRMSLFLTRAPHSVYLTESWHVKMEQIERFAFYERARKAYCIVMTGETAIYANIILKKGVVKA